MMNDYEMHLTDLNLFFINEKSPFRRNQDELFHLNIVDDVVW